MADLVKRQLAGYGRVSRVERDKMEPHTIECTVLFQQQFYGREFERLVKAVEQEQCVELYTEVTVQDQRDAEIADLKKQLTDVRAECRKLGGTP
jgi:hypothetical protein